MKTLALAATLTLAALCLDGARAAPGLPSTNVAWLAVAADADIERAFGKARAEKKPVLLYWGASWCPPCNQLKATFFNRQDFAAQSRAFVAVHVDGDRPAAQKLGRRFNVAGYPSVLLLRPDGTEITRLPGEVDAAQMMAVLQLGLSGGRPVKAVLADARAGRALQPNEWRLLAFYSWETDHERLVPKAELPAVLTQLAVAAPAADAETASRLWLKALAASDEGRGVKPDAALRERVLRVLADPAQARAQMDVLVNEAPALVRTLADEDAPERAPLVAAFEAALRRLEADPTLSRADRLSALTGRVELARIGEAKAALHVKLAPALLAELREHVARADREITDGYERQAVIPGAAHALGRAGLWGDSDALLLGNLARSHSPYYLMSQLGGNARKLGRAEEALRWYQRAFDQSEGPATRLQWGASYLAALVELAPQDEARIEKAAAQLFTEAGRDKGAFYERSARSLQRVGDRLRNWNRDGRHDAALRRLQAQLNALCGRLGSADGQRAACQAVLAPGKPAAPAG